MDRRAFMTTTALAGIGLLAPRALATEAPLPAHQALLRERLNDTFQTIFDTFVNDSPESATSLGLDKGERAGLKYRLDDSSLGGVEANAAMTRKALAMMDAYERQPLSDTDALNLACIRYTTGRDLVAFDKYGLGSIGRPYRIFQQGGNYFSTPDFLNSAHTIADRADSEAYLARLDAFSTALDQDNAAQEAYAARGYLAPSWSLDLTLGQLAKLRGQPAASCSMVRSLADRASKAGLSGDWAGRAEALVTQKVYPALDRQIALLEKLKPTSAAGDGLWRVPRGNEMYADALASSTTTDMTPEQVHALGIEQVRDITAQLDVILRGEGLSQGSVGERLTALNVRADQIYADSAEGRTELLAGLESSYRDILARMPRAFNDPPNTPLDIRAVPVEIQDGASNGYYRRAALDGSRPAIYFINLKSVGDWPKYGLPALTIHEGVPGHHLQISMAQAAGDLPMLRKTAFLSAYGEGWALYSEQLADELGAYKSPLERAGYLQSFLFRAARLVVDTGLHAKRWDRAKATRYMVETTGFAEPRCQREVERYCTQPGQACSYKVGHAAWVRARQKAQAIMGNRFDLKAFHDVLRDGAMPLAILEQRIEARARAAMKG
jgi:uncharacterized protein (DUF885 family)